MSFGDAPHKFDPTMFQGREQLSCTICGYMENAEVHTTNPLRTESDTEMTFLESLAADVRNGFICAEWKQFGEGPILDFETTKCRQVVYRCDRPDGHTHDHFDSILGTNWPQARPKFRTAQPKFSGVVGFEECDHCGKLNAHLPSALAGKQELPALDENEEDSILCADCDAYKRIFGIKCGSHGGFSSSAASLEDTFIGNMKARDGIIAKLTESNQALRDEAAKLKGVGETQTHNLNWINEKFIKEERRAEEAETLLAKIFEFTFIAADGARVTIDIETAQRQYGRHLKEIATLKEALRNVWRDRITNYSAELTEKVLKLLM